MTTPFNFKFINRSNKNLALCGITMFDVLFVEYLAKYFKCFRGTTSITYGVRARYCFEIVRRLGCPYYKNIDSPTLRTIFYNVFFNKDKKGGSPAKDFRSNLIDKTNKYDKNLLELAEKEISNYFLKVEKRFDKGVLKYFKNNPVPNVDILHGRYRVLKPGSVFCYDITNRDNLYVLLVVDLASRFIPARLVSFTPITAEMSARFFDKFFSNLCKDDKITLLFPPEKGENYTDSVIIDDDIISEDDFSDSISEESSESDIEEGWEDDTSSESDPEEGELETLEEDDTLSESDPEEGEEKEGQLEYYELEAGKNKYNEGIILHSDGAGVNVSSAVRKVCARYGIQMSISSEVHGNQVCENVNRTFWYFVSQFCIKGLENVPTLELPSEYQVVLIDVAINYMNTNDNTKANKLLENTSPINKNMASLMYNYPYQVIARPNSKGAALIIYVYSTAVSMFKNQLLQYRLQLEKGISIFLAEMPESYIERKKEFIKTNPTIDEEISQSKQDFLVSQQENAILKSMMELGTTDEILVYLDNLIKDEKSKLSFDTKLMTTLSGIMIQLQKSTNDQLSELKSQVVESNERNKELQEKIDNLQKDITAMRDIQRVEVEKRKERDLELIRRKIRKKRQTKSKYAIFNEDFKVVLECVNSKQRYILCRDKIGHGFLKYTGLRISNLKFVTLGQLQKFFDYEDLTIQPIKSKNLQPLVIPVVKEASNIIESIRPFWNELKNILKEKGIVIDENYNPYDVKESELWGNNKDSKLGKSITREELTRRMNSQLKAAGIILRKRLTTHSYRRGIAIQIGKTRGIYAAKKILNHTSIATTQVYLESETTRKELLDIYKSAHKYSNTSDDAPNFDNLDEKEFKLKIEKLLDEDEDKHLALEN